MLGDVRSRRVAAQQQAAHDRFLDTAHDRFASQVPAEYRGHDLSDMTDQSSWGRVLDRSAVVSLSRYMRDPSRFIVMVGPTGTGKSTAAYAIADRLIDTFERSARFVSATVMLSEFSFGSGEKSGAEVLHEYCAVPILVIDDLGTANDGMSAHQERSMWALIDARWANGLHTIITSNMAVADSREGRGLAGLLGTSAWDRVQDSCTVVMFSGDSFRGQRD